MNAFEGNLKIKNMGYNSWATLINEMDGIFEN
jgi:hypothetical protein